MRKMKAVIVIVTMLVAATTAFGAFDPTNLAFNPDFETGDLTDWFTGGSATIGILSDDNGPFESGTHCVAMATPGSRDLRSQGIPVTVGKQYQLTFDYKTSTGATGNPQVRFRFWDGLGTGGTFGTFKGEAQRTLDRTNGQWVTVAPLTYTAPEGAVAADIVFTVNVFGSFGGEVRIDNITVLEELEVGQAVTVSPLPDEEGVLPTAQLQWQAPRNPSSPADADPNTLAFVVYCDPNLVRLEAATYDNHAGVPYFSDQLLVGDITSDPIQSFDPVPDLAENTTYYWRVDTRNDTAVEPNDVFPGIILSFNTNLAPDNVVAASEIVLPAETNGIITVTADDPPATGLSYQWYIDYDPAATGDEVALSDGSKYSGTDTASLTVINPVLGYPTDGGDEGYFVCDVSNTSGTTRSNSARLVIGRLVNHYALDGNYVDSASGYDAVRAGLGQDPNWPAGQVGTNALELYGDEGVFIDLAQAVTNYPAQTYPTTVQQVTVTAWVQAKNLSGWKTIAGNWGDGLFQMAVNPAGQLNFEISQPGGVFYVTDSQSFPTDSDEWQFVAAVADGSQIHLYRMGANEAVTARSFEVGSRAYDGNLRLGNSNAGIGCYTDDGILPLNSWNGKIDDVRIYNYGLSAEAVADIYGSSVCLYSDNPADPHYLNTALDLDANCKVDLGDLAELADGWLTSGIYTP